jgi:hypothetical protein
MEWDRLEHRYSAYCLEYDVWLDWEGDNGIDDFVDDEDEALRSKICFYHGRPTSQEELIEEE